MLWWDNSRTAITVKVRKAVEYYVKKYGRHPDLCLVHPSMMDQTREIDVPELKLKIRSYQPVLIGHLWIGIEENVQ